MKTSLLLAAASLAIAGVAHAQQSPDAADHPTGTQAPALLSEGEVRKVDLEQGKITLRHGPLANLDMPAMTMVFTATDMKMLQGVQRGDKVKFNAARKDDIYFVTGLEVVR